MTPETHQADNVHDYVHGLLSANESAQLEAHCATCLACQRALDQARRQADQLRALPPAQPSETLVAETMQKVRAQHSSESSWRKRYLVGSIAASLLLAVMLGWWTLQATQLKPTPFDLQVFSQNSLLADTPASLQVRLLNRLTGEGVAGVPVLVEMVHQKTKQVFPWGQFVTSKDGLATPQAKLPDWPVGECSLSIVAKTPSAPEQATRSLSLKRAGKVLVSCDKPVYQPGQTIYFRSLALDAYRHKPLAGRQALLTVHDARQNLIHKQAGVTSPFGLAWTECPLAHEILPGTYTLTAKIDETESTLSVEVFKYKLPSFKLHWSVAEPRDVANQALPSFFLAGAKVHAKLHAEYFLGKPLAHAQAEVTLLDKASRLTSQVLTTNEQGQADFKFDLPPSFTNPLDDVAQLVLQTKVRDQAGQEETLRLPLRVATKPYRVEVLPEGGVLSSGVKNTVYVLASHADEKPLADAELIVSASSALQPNREFKLRTDATGFASFELTPQESESHQVQVQYAGQLLTVPALHIPASPSQEALLARVDKSLYRVGETMQLEILGTGTTPVFVDLLKEGHPLTSQQVVLTNGRGTLALDLASEMVGTLFLQVYRPLPGGNVKRVLRPVVVQPSTQLQVSAQCDRAEYKPGESAQVRFQVKNAAGLPAPGALSLACVDEAVFRVLPQSASQESQRVVFDPKLLVRPKAGWANEDSETYRRQIQAELLRQTRVLSSDTRAYRVSEKRSDRAPMTAPNLRRQIGSSEVLPEESAFQPSSSYPTKLRRCEVARADTEERVIQSWVGWFLLTAALGYGLLWFYVRPLYMILITGFLLGGMMLVVGVSFFLSFGSSSPKFAMGGKAESQAVADEASAGRTVEFFSEQVRAPGTAPESDSAKPKVRRRFTETLHWQPELLTDDQGEAVLTLPLADSITTWRMQASAISAQGELGQTTLSLRAFQPFFIECNPPINLTRNDEFSLPVIVHNHQDANQTVRVRLSLADWFEPTDASTVQEVEGRKVLEQVVELTSKQVRRVNFAIRVKKAGKQKLLVTAVGSNKQSDALENELEILPDGYRHEAVHNGLLRQPAEHTVTLPEGVIEGSSQAYVKLYPSSYSQLVEGLDKVFELPSGCFEQTSSTTYPNVLALQYLQLTHKADPKTEAKAKQYIQLGYQRLLSFEVSGGGFDWYGRAPADIRLTAYGLLEFTDMAKVAPVDPALLQRTRRWLLKQRGIDGAWEPRNFGSQKFASIAKLTLTAYTAWAVFQADGPSHPDASLTERYLLNYPPEAIENGYTLALVCQALQSLKSSRLPAYQQRLSTFLAQPGNAVIGQKGQLNETLFHGQGISGNIEATALAVLSLRSDPDRVLVVDQALGWLVSQRDPRGLWYSTQATIMTLKALLSEGANAPPVGERELLVKLGDQVVEKLRIVPEQSDVVHLLDLTKHLQPGTKTLSLSGTNLAGLNYQLYSRYHTQAAPPAPAKPADFSAQLSFNKSTVAVHESVLVTARIENKQAVASQMLMVELPIPAGCSLQTDLLESRLGKEIAKYEVKADKVLLYLDRLAQHTSLSLEYRLIPLAPAKVQVAPARVYEYYDVHKQGTSESLVLVVK